MLDCFAVFDRGGSVLWSETFIALSGRPMDVLVREVLLQERASATEFVWKAYRIQWALENELGLVFACVSPKVIPMPYVSDLLKLCRADFLDRYGAQLRGPDADPDHVNCDDFSERFPQLRDYAESRAKKPRQKPATKAISQPVGLAESTPDTTALSGTPDDEVSAAGTTESNIERNKARFIAQQAAKGRSTRRANDLSSTTRSKSKSAAAAVDNGPLDHSVGAGPDLGSKAREVTNEEVEHNRRKYLNADEASTYDLLDEYNDDDDLDRLAEQALTEKTSTSSEVKPKSGVSRMFGFLQGLAGKVDLSREELDPALGEFREMLMSKNVAPDIAEKLCDSVGSSLVGKRMESLSTVRKTVHNAMAGALTRILTPKQSVDLLVDIETAKRESSRPYVIVFCGYVNGVGKSTSLSKICYHLQAHGLSVLMAACDTFRAGAVEQLRTHARCLDVDVFEKGYGKDAASVAFEAIQQASVDGVDVVLVDTAGRMQDNEPLMKSLAKLVQQNNPNRVFFVGEALVGNDAVDQLTKFNQALANNQRTQSPQVVDGIVLTKFDTIDDKVGAAVSMVYSTGKPIVFVGVGQTYMDLRTVNTEALVRALLR